MARNTPLYFGVNGIAEKLSKVYFGDPNNVAQEVKKIYEGDANGIARLKYHLHEFIDGSDGFKTCQLCGATEAIPTPDHTHNYSSTTINPTCTERGYTTHTCGCGDNYKDNYVEALGHAEVIDEAVEATCTMDGLTEGKHCSRCNEVLVAQTTINAPGHDFVDGVCSVCNAIDPNCEHKDTTTSERVINEPTCVKQGSKTVTVTCNICDNVVSTTTEKIPALGHNEGETVLENVIDSTCGTSGSYDEVIYCTVCAAEVSRNTITRPATGDHKYDNETEVQEATCEENGYRIMACSCGATKRTVITATGHTPETVPGKAPTCTEPGLTSGMKCSDCHKILEEQKELPAAHTDENNDNICDACGESLCDPHSIETIPAVAATCLTSGWTEGKRCSVCGKVLVAQQEIPADPLNPDAHDLIHLGTYCSGDHINSGKNLYECARAGCKYSVVLDDGLLGDIIHTSPVEHDERPASCTENGFTAGITCSNCGVDNRQLIPTPGHTEYTLEGYAATCQATGLTDGTRCSVCGEITKKQETIAIDPEAHTRTEGIPVAPTCEEDGYIPYVCSCGDVYKAVNFGSALGHTEEVIEGYAATCQKTGLTDGKKCSTCGKTLKAQETIAINPNAHNHVAGIPVDPTCTEDGYIPYSCACGDTYNAVNFGSALEHNAGTPVEEDRVEPTCTTAGSYQLVTYCTRCGTKLSSETKAIPATGHDHKAGIYVDATCTDDAYTPYRCHCGDTYNEVAYGTAGCIPGTPVEEDRVEPTCTTAGSYKLVTYCTRCGNKLNSETSAIPATGHDHKAGIPVAATCEEDSYTPYTCHCGDTYSQVAYGTALGHSGGTPVEESRTDPTCTKAGSRTLVTYCTRCNVLLDRDTETLNATGHDHKAGIPVAATCTADAYTPYTCHCGDTYNEVAYGTAGCTPGTPKEESRTNPTCTKAGSSTVVTRCTRCNTVLDSETSTIPATGHNHVAGIPVAATCTEDGYTPYRCSCGDTYNQVAYGTAGHKYTSSTTDPTCTSPGSTKYTCSACNHSYTEEIPALGHSFVGGKCTRCKIPEDSAGCVFAGTQIALDADTSIDIADFVGGTPIDFCNPSTLEHTPQQTLTRFFSEKATDKVVITLEDGKSLELTPNHVVLTEEGFKAYLDNYMYPKYAIGDKLATVDGYKAIVSIEEETIPETTVYNIATENSLMVANGIIVAGELDYNISTLALGGNTSKDIL